MLFRIIKISSFSILLVGTFSYLTSCKPKSTTAGSEQAAYVIPGSLMDSLVIDTVKMANMTTSIKFNGIVDFNPDKVVNIFPLISGNVEDVRADVGDFVKAGQVLGVVKSSEVASYNAALINAQAAVKLNATLLAKTRDMAKSGLASQVDVTTAQANYDQAVAAEVAARKILSINGNNTNGEYVIKSPIDGFVVQKNVTNGMAIRTDNGNNLFTISDLKEVWVQANVYEANINNVHESDSADVTTITEPDKVYHGKINKLLNTLDPTNRVMKLRIVLPNTDYKLKPQMFATVTVTNDLERKAISVPMSALIFDHSQYYVMVFHSKSDVQIRQVEVLNSNNRTVYIKNGVEPGEKVIASQAILIYGALNN